MIDPIAGWRNREPKRGSQSKKPASGFSKDKAVQESDGLAFVGLIGLTFAMLTSSVTVALVA